MVRGYFIAILLFCLLSFVRSEAQVSQRYFGRSGSSDMILRNVQLNNGNEVGVGFRWTNSMNNCDAIIVCVDPSDNIVWAKQIGTPGNDRFIGVTATADGGCVAVGFANQGLNTLYTGNHAIIYKFDAAGNIVWSRAFNNTSPGELFTSVIEIPGSGNLAVTGFYNWASGVNSGMIVNFSSTGNINWAKTYDRSGSDELRDLVYLNGKIIATGFYQGVSFYDGTVLAVHETNGNSIWARSFNYNSQMPGGNNCQVPSFIQVHNDRIYIDLDNDANYNGGTNRPALLSLDTFGLNPICLEYAIAGTDYPAGGKSLIVSPTEIYLLSPSISTKNNSVDLWLETDPTKIGDGAIARINSMTATNVLSFQFRSIATPGYQMINNIRLEGSDILGFGGARNDVANQIGDQDIFKISIDRSLPYQATDCINQLLHYRVYNPLVALNANFSFTESSRTLTATTLTPQITDISFNTVNPCPTSNQMIINRYAAVQGRDSCTNKFRVDDATGFSAGDTVLVIQMKGAEIDMSNTASFGTVIDYKGAGNYEYNVVSSVTGNEIALVYELTRKYDIPDGKVQFVRVPSYQNYTVSQPHTAAPWDGNKGGVFAIRVNGVLTLNDDIDVSAKGFRGGVASVNFYPDCASMDYYYNLTSGHSGGKGESIVELPPAFGAGRAPVASGGGGGNNHNTGGGGGSNSGRGGRGGDPWSGCPIVPIGGDGGLDLAYNNTANKIFLGGGGGGAQQNDATGNPGKNGGGIIIIEAGSVIGNGITLNVKGEDNLATSTLDGSGGGGGGGTILISSNAITGSCNVLLSGGKGGNTTYVAGRCLGNGGGGGGGIFWTNASVPSSWNINLIGGLNGTGTGPCGAHGSTAGQPGSILTNLTIPKSSVPYVAPPVLQLLSNSPICAGDTLKLFVNNNYPSSTQYSWIGPGGFISVDQNPVIPNVSSLGSGIYRASVDIGQCVLTEQINITVHPSPTVDLGQDTSICKSSLPYILQSNQPPGSQHLWSDGSTASQLQVFSPGNYSLRVTDGNGCVGHDSMELKVVDDPIVNIGNDTTICEFEKISIGTMVNGAGYRWNNGATSPYITVSSTGVYILEVDLDGCMVTDTLVLVVNPLPIVNLGNDTTICASSLPFVLNSGQPASAKLLWSDGSSGLQLVANSADLYWLEVRDGSGCKNRDSIMLNVVQDPIVNIGNDTTICEREKITIGTQVPSAGYRWNTGSTSAFIDATAAGLYILEVNLQGCVVSDSLTLTVAPLPTVNLGPDTTICNSSLPFVLDAGSSVGSSYLWQDQSTGSTFEVNGSGLYWLQVTSGSGCINRDSIVVTAVADPSFSLGNDTTICEGDQLRIGANLPNANYLWNNGSADGYIEIAESGTYILTVDRSGCIYRDTLNLTIAPIPKLQLEKDRVVCPDETIVLDATVGGNNQYRWSTGDAVAAISVKEPGSYTVTVTSEFGCVAVGRVQVSRGSLPSVELGGDTSICDGAEFMLQPIADNYDMLIWQDGTSSSDYWVRSTGSYYVAAGNQCGTVADTVEVAIVFCDIWVPDAFTPNGDGLNDIFKAVGSLGQLSEFELAVFNRWGQVVFRTQDPVVGWDGRFNGSEQPVGTYTYLLKFSFVDKPHVLKGNFHLIR